MFKRFCCLSEGKCNRGRSRVNPHMFASVLMQEKYMHPFFSTYSSHGDVEEAVRERGGVNPGEVTNQSQH